jgi:hypothetical protein
MQQDFLVRNIALVCTNIIFQSSTFARANFVLRSVKLIDLEFSHSEAPSSNVSSARPQSKIRETAKKPYFEKYLILLSKLVSPDGIEPSTP